MPTLCFSENPSAHKAVVFANLPANLAVRPAWMMSFEADTVKTKIMFRIDALNHQQTGAVPAAHCKISCSKQTLEQKIAVPHCTVPQVVQCCCKRFAQLHCAATRAEAQLDEQSLLKPPEQQKLACQALIEWLITSDTVGISAHFCKLVHSHFSAANACLMASINIFMHCDDIRTVKTPSQPCLEQVKNLQFRDPFVN